MRPHGTSALFGILLLLSAASFGHAEEQQAQGFIEANENLALTVMNLVLFHATFPRQEGPSTPPKDLSFMEGVDSGAGKVHVKPDGTVELSGYAFWYVVEDGHIVLSARPITPGVTGNRFFAFGKRPEGILQVSGMDIENITVEDSNQNGRVDAGERQLKP